MAIICDVPETFMTYLKHIPNFKVLCKGIFKLSTLWHFTFTQGFLPTLLLISDVVLVEAFTKCFH